MHSVAPQVKQAASERTRPGPKTAALTLLAAAFVFYGLQLFRLISEYAVNIFFWDEWDLKNATLFQKYSLWQMFVSQHGWHRLGLGAWFEQVVDPPTHFNSRTESFVLGWLLIIAVICAIWLKVRLTGNFSVFDVVIPAIFLTPGQWEVLYGSPIFSQGALPTVLILLYCIAWTSGKAAVRYPLVLLLNFAIIYTGFGLFLGFLTPLLLVIDHVSRTPEDRLSKPYFMSALAVSVFSICSFFIGYHATADIACFSFQLRSPHFYIVFMGLMWAHLLGFDSATFWPRVIGKMSLFFAVICLIYAAWSLLPRKGTLSGREYKTRFAATTLMAFSLALCATISYMRICGGVAAGLASRYTVYMQFGALGIYFFLLGIRKVHVRAILLVAFIVPLLTAALHADRAGMAYFHNIKQQWKECYLQTENIHQCDQVAGFPMRPNAERTHMQQKLDFLKQHKLNLYLEAK